MARSLSYRGKSERYVPKPIRKLSSLKKVVQPVRLSEFVSHVRSDKSVLNTLWHMMSALESGADYQSVNAVALSAVQLKSNNNKNPKLLTRRVKENWSNFLFKQEAV
jgi:hypothetical protein